MFSVKKIFDPRRKVSSLLDSGLFVALGSLFWLLLRSGTKPSRIIYPCQQTAKNNLIIFGFPAFGVLIARYRKCPRFRQKIFRFSFLSFIGLFLIPLGIGFYHRYRTVPKSITALVYGQSIPPNVVWVRHNSATVSSYNVSAGSQVVVDQMFEEGLKALAERSSVGEAWSALLPCGQSCQGKKITIKVNFNNNFVYDGWPMTCTQGGCPIVQTCLALTRQLVNRAGFRPEDVWFYDSSRTIASYLTTAISAEFPQVRFNPYAKAGSSQVVSGISQATYGRELVEADYLINMPLLRNHGMSGVTLSFKNHVGSVACNNGGFECQRGYHGTFYTNSAVNPLVQLNAHSLIRDKTVLIVADALFATLDGGPDGPPNLRSNSIFLSRDPVAADSVMIDFLQSQNANISHSGDCRIYLRVAGQNSLGNFSTSCGQGSSCSFTYPNINLIRCPEAVCPSLSPTPTEVPTPTSLPTPTAVLIPGDLDGDGDVDIFDYNLLVQNFGRTNQPGVVGDLDGDGDVDIFDYNLLVGNFGR